MYILQSDPCIDPAKAFLPQPFIEGSRTKFDTTMRRVVAVYQNDSPEVVESWQKFERIDVPSSDDVQEYLESHIDAFHIPFKEVLFSGKEYDTNALDRPVVSRLRNVEISKLQIVESTDSVKWSRRGVKRKEIPVRIYPLPRDAVVVGDTTGSTHQTGSSRRNTTNVKNSSTSHKVSTAKNKKAANKTNKSKPKNNNKKKFNNIYDSDVSTSSDEDKKRAKKARINDESNIATQKDPSTSRCMSYRCDSHSDNDSDDDSDIDEIITSNKNNASTENLGDKEEHSRDSNDHPADNEEEENIIYQYETDNDMVDLKGYYTKRRNVDVKNYGSALLFVGKEYRLIGGKEKEEGYNNSQAGKIVSVVCNRSDKSTPPTLYFKIFDPIKHPVRISYLDIDQWYFVTCLKLMKPDKRISWIGGLPSLMGNTLIGARVRRIFTVDKKEKAFRGVVTEYLFQDRYKVEFEDGDVQKYPGKEIVMSLIYPDGYP
jgi:hypothetical protein